MKHQEIEELRKDIKVLNDSITELQKNLVCVATACGIQVPWFSYRNEGRYRLSYGPIVSNPLALKEQVQMLMEYLGVEVHVEPAVPEKYVLRKTPKKC